MVVDIDAVGLGRRDIAGCAEPRSKADGGVTTGQRVVVGVVFSVVGLQSFQCLGKVIDGDDGVRVNACRLEVVDTVADQVCKDGGFFAQAVDMTVRIADKRLVIGVVVNVLLQVGGILLNVGCQICEHALRTVDVGLGQLCHNSIGQIAADNTLVNLRVDVSCLFGAGDIVNMDPGAFLGNIIPLQFLDPVHVGRTHKHGVGVGPIAGRFRRGGSRRGGASAATGEKRADHSSGQYGSADSICEFHLCFPPYI